MQGGDDLLRKNLEAFGERDGEKRRTAISTIWSLTEYSSILTVRTLAPKQSITLSRVSAEVSGFRFQRVGCVPNSHNGTGRLTWGFGPEGKKPTVEGLDVIVSKTGKIKALYTLLDPAERWAQH